MVNQTKSFIEEPVVVSHTRTKSLDVPAAPKNITAQRVPLTRASYHSRALPISTSLQCQEQLKTQKSNELIQY
jgi:hypothetical protein